MTIRPMTEADIDAVMKIADALPEAPHWPRSAYLAALDPAARPQRLALIAVDDVGQLAGFIVLAIIAGEAELESIAVAASAQRQGIGRVLLASAISALKTGGCTAILLEVRASNAPARALYAALGFAESGRRLAYYRDPAEDAVLMRRYI